MDCFPVSARETHSGVEASIVVKPSYGLTDTEIARMLEESGKSAETDMQQRALREEIVEAERTIQATQVALDSDGDLLNDTERTAIEALMEVTKKLLNDDSTSAIHAAIEALSKGTETFAARRMNRSIQKALSGKTVRDII